MKGGGFYLDPRQSSLISRTYRPRRVGTLIDPQMGRVSRMPITPDQAHPRSIATVNPVERIKSIIWRMWRTIKLLTLTLALTSSAFASTFVVSRGDDGPGTGTLRWAITEANALPGRDTIHFEGVNLIQPQSALPDITDSVWMNDVDSLVIQIDGQNAGDAGGLVLRANYSILNGLLIENFAGDGLLIASDDNEAYFITASNNRNGVRISGNRNSIFGSQFGATSIGLRGNREAGLIITTGANNNRIGKTPDVVSDLPRIIPIPTYPAGPNTALGNGGAGMIIDGNQNVIEANAIGAEALVQPNNGDGIVVRGASNSLINNYVSYNRGNGIKLLNTVNWSFNRGACNGGDFVSTLLPRPPAPRIVSAINDQNAVTINAEVEGVPNQRFDVEFQAPVTKCDGSQPRVLGRVFVMTDDNGFGSTRIAFENPAEQVTAFIVSGVISDTVSADPDTNRDHRADIEINTTGPTLSSVGGREIFETTVTNHGPAAEAKRIKIIIPHLANARSTGLTTTSGKCTLGATEDQCTLGVVAAGDTVVIEHGLWFTKSGTSRYSVTSTLTPMPGDIDPNPANDTATVMVTVPDLARQRTVRH